ncbi:phage tail protein [Clostridium gasigenes]|uniref:phage distal tail protein n=1 Tax=Clostridium gasigenes TaxID=94869 RepID=UPI0014383CB2|nr:phage tail protein [Clostridium gasigenes]NKF05306.1 phage tail protein [Clostridium gasigenes]QSW18760.1 phage tail protein [Clostridium gasigenes]
MFIDNRDIGTFGAMLLNYDIQNAELETKKDWLSKAYRPILINQKFYYKKINIELIVEGLDREDVLTKCSNLSNALKSCTIKFKDMSFYYDCILDSCQIEKSISSNLVKLNYTLSAGYAYKSIITESCNRIATKTMKANGNLITPCIVEITPSIDIIDIAIEGLGEDQITIRNLKANKTVILDGELCKVTENEINKFNDTDMWEFPRLIPSDNVLKFSRNNCDIKIKYNARFI